MSKGSTIPDRGLNRIPLIARISAAALFLAVLVVLGSGLALCAGWNHSVPKPAEPGFRRIEIKEVDGKATVAWLLDGRGRKAFILAHGNGSDRNSMVPRALYFHDLGYTVLLPDLHGHGETRGNRKTFGIEEGKDIRNAFLYLRETAGKDWIGGLGTSLGGAAILNAEVNGTPFDALILESVFSDIRTAARHRLETWFGKAGRFLSPLLVAQIPIWLGVPADELSPLHWAESVRCPTLVLSGSMDERAQPWEAEALFRNLPVSEKAIRFFDGAGHVDLFKNAGGGYREEVESFLVRIAPGSPEP
ncbi:MAG: putative lipase [Fibrobacteres bacterium]|nr:putative lipase [Fibrobacterota bacterium]